MPSTSTLLSLLALAFSLSQASAQDCSAPNGNTFVQDNLCCPGSPATDPDGSPACCVGGMFSLSTPDGFPFGTASELLTSTGGTCQTIVPFSAADFSSLVAAAPGAAAAATTAPAEASAAATGSVLGGSAAPTESALGDPSSAAASAVASETSVASSAMQTTKAPKSSSLKTSATSSSARPSSSSSKAGAMQAVVTEGPMWVVAGVAMGAAGLF